MNQLRHDKEGFIYDSINEELIVELVYGSYKWSNLDEIVRRFNEHDQLQHQNTELQADLSAVKQGWEKQVEQLKEENERLRRDCDGWHKNYLKQDEERKKYRREVKQYKDMVREFIDGMVDFAGADIIWVSDELLAKAKEMIKEDRV